MTDQHEPAPFYGDAGTPGCPHGPGSHPRHQPDGPELWRCLDVHVGDYCPACSTAAGTGIAWSYCRQPARPAP